MGFQTPAAEWAINGGVFEVMEKPKVDFASSSPGFQEFSDPSAFGINVAVDVLEGIPSEVFIGSRIEP